MLGRLTTFRHKLIDEYQVCSPKTAVGEGETLFKNKIEWNSKLQGRSKSNESGVILLIYTN